MNGRLSHAEETLSRKRVRELFQAGEPPHVSLFMPTHREWNKVKENRLTFDNLLQQAQDGLQHRELANSEAWQLLEPAYDLLKDDSFWRKKKDGLAVFVAGEHFSAHRLPYNVPKASFVDRRFHIRPLWRHLEPYGRYYVLALSQGGVKFFRGFRYTLREVDLEDTPTTLDEALEFDEHIRSVTPHTKSPPVKGEQRAEIFHGQEDAGDKAYIKEGIIRFFQEVENAVTGRLRQEATPPPLVLAGIGVLRGLYRKVNHYAHVTEVDLDGHHFDWSADEFDASELHEGAWKIVESIFAEERSDAAARYEQLEGTEDGAGSIDTVIPAAYEHRIESLFVSEEDTAWGRYDATKRRVNLHEDAHAGDTELLNAAAVWTLEGDGDVYVVDPDDVPGGEPVAAVLRY